MVRPLVLSEAHIGLSKGVEGVLSKWPIAQLPSESEVIEKTKFPGRGGGSDKSRE